jgi:hypothetical protein
MAQIPPMTVVFDDGTEVRIEPKPRDMVRAEVAGIDFTGNTPMQGMYAVAFATLGRMGRAGNLPEGLVVPETLEAMIDIADVVTDEDDDAGEG